MLFLHLLRCTSNTSNTRLCVALHHLVLHHGKFEDMKVNQSGRVYWHFLQFILQIGNLHEGNPTRKYYYVLQQKNNIGRVGIHIKIKPWEKTQSLYRESKKISLIKVSLALTSSSSELAFISARLEWLALDKGTWFFCFLHSKFIILNHNLVVFMEMGNILIVFLVVAAWEACSGKPDVGNNTKVFLNTYENCDLAVYENCDLGCGFEGSRMGKGFPFGSHAVSQSRRAIIRGSYSNVWCTARERIRSSSVSSLR